MEIASDAINHKASREGAIAERRSIEGVCWHHSEEMRFELIKVFRKRRGRRPEPFDGKRRRRHADPSEGFGRTVVGPSEVAHAVGKNVSPLERFLAGALV